MNNAERRKIRKICEHVLNMAGRIQGTANTEVLQQSVVRLRALLRRGRLRQAEDVAYGVLMDVQGLSDDSSDEESAEDHETSKTPNVSVEHTVNIGRSIKFVRVAAELRQGDMAERLGISQNYLSLLENNKAEPSLALLRRICSEFNVPLSFLLLEGTTDFESDDPEMNTLLQELKTLIHDLQRSRIKEDKGAPDGTNKSAG